MNDRELIQLAHQARLQAYAPYSNFQVGAALETDDGTVYLGCNIENASYGASNCAERTAFFKALSEGKRHFVKIAIVGGPQGSKTCSTCAPCGICRQVMSEFCDKQTFRILLESGDGKIKSFTLDELLPMAFEKNDVCMS